LPPQRSGLSINTDSINAPKNPLSAVEKLILQLYSEGRTQPEIAHQLDVPPHLVKHMLTQQILDLAARLTPLRLKSN
jgi:hypothetical protein